MLPLFTPTYEESAGWGMSATSLRSVLILGINDTWEYLLIAPVGEQNVRGPPSRSRTSCSLQYLANTLLPACNPEISLSVGGSVKWRPASDRNSATNLFARLFQSTIRVRAFGSRKTKRRRLRSSDSNNHGRKSLAALPFQVTAFHWRSST